MGDNIYPEMVLNVLKKMQSNSLDNVKQNDLDACYWHQRKDSDGKIDFKNMTSLEVDRFVKALAKPYPGAWITHNGKKLRIYKTNIIDMNIRGTSGRICWIQNLGPLVICSDQAISLNEYIYAKY